MRYMVVWHARHRAGKEGEDDLQRLLDLFASWSRSSDHFFNWDFLLFRADREGGYALVDSDDYEGLLDSVASFEPFTTFEIIPVLNPPEAVKRITDAASQRWADGD